VLLPVVSRAKGVVLAGVLDMSNVVLIAILEHGAHDNEDKWGQHRGLTSRDRYDLDGLQDGDYDEVDICCLGQLLEEIDGDECEPVVHARRHNVVFHVQLQFFKPLSRHVDDAILLLATKAEQFLEPLKTLGYSFC